METALDNAGAARAKTSDANSFLYLVRANQLFAEGAAERIKAIKAPALLIYSPGDLVFPADSVRRTARLLKANGVAVERSSCKATAAISTACSTSSRPKRRSPAFLAK